MILDFILQKVYFSGLMQVYVSLYDNNTENYKKNQLTWLQ